MEKHLDTRRIRLNKQLMDKYGYKSKYPEDKEVLETETDESEKETEK